ncbi:signal peptidase I [Patescibacteria group bacterium]|nr:signal peptidase I [Patescibacteria group bacterium]
MSVLRKVFKVVYEMIEAFVVSASVFVVVYLFLMQPHQVKGSSMFPTFETGEYLLTDKVTLKRREPLRGDVIVFKSPLDENFDFIKRVIGIPGDTVMVKGGYVYVDGELLDESYLPSDYRTSAGQFLQEGVGYVVQESSVMAFGDNRNHSSDSREWGPVPYENIVGRAFFRYWPSDSVGVVTNPNVN